MEQDESVHLNLELIFPWSICIMALPHNTQLKTPENNCTGLTLNRTSWLWNPSWSTICGRCTGLEVPNEKWKPPKSQLHKECKHQRHSGLLLSTLHLQPADSTKPMARKPFLSTALVDKFKQNTSAQNAPLFFPLQTMNLMPIK